MQQFKHYISRVTNNIIVKQLGFALLLLTLSRIVWFGFNKFWLEPFTFGEVARSLAWGTYFDLPVVAFFFLPLWIWTIGFPRQAKVYTSITAWLFVLGAAICLTLNGIDTIYSQITTRRSGYELFSAMADPGNRIGPYLWTYGAGVIALLLALFLIYKAAPRQGHSLYLYQGKKSLMFLKLPLVLGLWLLAARGGFGLKPLRAVDAGRYAGVKYVPLISSTPFQLISTWGQPQLVAYHFMDPEKARKIIGYGQGSLKPDADPQHWNIVVIVVESLGRDYTGFLNQQPYTPFLDSLSKRSVVFPFCYANGIRSIEMVPSVFCGIPAMMDEHYVNSIYAANKVENIFSWFGRQGYATAFFHGATNGTMRFQSFLQSTGLQSYYGLSEYPNRDADYDGSWGIYDEPYLQYVARYLDTVHKPFFTGVFTLSSHHPYKIPEQYEGKLPKGPLPIHQTVAYTDLALRKFFERAQKTTWYKNTIFVITGDHTSHSKKPYFYSQTGHYEIPLLFFSEQLRPQTINKTVSQCDIMPTLLDLMPKNNNWPSFGRSALDSTYLGYSFHRDNRINYIIQYPYTLGMNDQGKVTDFYSRQRNFTTVKHEKRSGPKYENMLLYLKAYLQVYSEILIANKPQ